MSDEEESLQLSQDAVLALVGTLATEVVRYGERESQLIENKKLSEEDVVIVMKANTLLTVFAMLLVDVVKSEDIGLAEKIVTCWISPAIQDMVSIAFADEIEDAAEVITQGIADLEDSLKETDESSSEQGD